MGGFIADRSYRWDGLVYVYYTLSRLKIDRYSFDRLQVILSNEMKENTSLRCLGKFSPTDEGRGQPPNNCRYQYYCIEH